jgi:hypothetical protein
MFGRRESVEGFTLTARQLKIVSEELAAQRALNVSLEKGLAVAHAQIEWLTQYIDIITSERSQLFERLMGTALSPVQLQFTKQDTPSAIAEPAERPLSEMTAAELRTRFMRQGPPAPQPMNVPLSQRREPPATVNELLQTDFEDVGDDAARRMGILHDRDGEIAYTK